MKRVLHACFSQFGRILDVVVMSKFRLRGQAWVVFEDVPAATRALRQLQGFPLYGKPMRIQYAREKSDAVAKADGTFRPRDRDEVAKLNAEKRDRLLGKRRRAEADMEMGGGGGGTEPGADADAAPLALGAAPGGAAAGSAPPEEAVTAPHRILFVQNLPEASTPEMITTLFEQFPGFQEARLVPAKPGIAFVEFADAAQAGVALNGLHGFKITPEKAMHVTFGKQ